MANVTRLDHFAVKGFALRQSYVVNAEIPGVNKEDIKVAEIGDWRCPVAPRKTATSSVIAREWAVAAFRKN
jgi:hypothetical protein